MSDELTQAIAKLDRHKHWTLRTINRKASRRAYECTIWGEGRRVSGQGGNPLLAILKAEEKLRLKTGPNLRVVR